MNWHGIKVVAVALVMAASSLESDAEETVPARMELTPPRLSFTDGKASFWRPGAEDWVPARINTSLAAGDALYTSERAKIEVQVGARALPGMPANEASLRQPASISKLRSQSK